MQTSNMTVGHFMTGDGQTAQGQEVVIPICKAVDGGKLECIGTGFFISIYGIFATAAHVVTDILGEDGKPQCYKDGSPKVGLMTFHFMPPNLMVAREINKISFHMRDDVAVGTVKTIVDQKTREPLKNKVLQLTARVPQVGDKISTWAYPNSVAEYDGRKGSLSVVPKLYEGEIEDEHRNGKGWGKVSGRCYQTNLGIEGGASGGPVFDDEGRVFAVNSGGVDGTDITYVSHLQSIGGLTLPNVQTQDGVVHENITICELIDRGSIGVDHIENVKPKISDTPVDKG